MHKTKLAGSETTFNPGGRKKANADKKGFGNERTLQKKSASAADNQYKGNRRMR